MKEPNQPVDQFFISTLDALKYVPFLIPLTYFTGYIIVSSYLSQYFPVDASGFDFYFYFAGFSCSLILLVSFYLVYVSYKSPSDSINKETLRGYDYMIRNISYVFSWLALVISFSIHRDPRLLYLVYPLVVSIIVYYTPGYVRIRRKNPDIIHLETMLCLVILVLLLVFYWQTIGTLFLLKVHTCLFFFVLFGRIGDRMLKFTKSLAVFIWIIPFIVYYSYFVYPNLPKHFGGGRPKEVVLITGEIDNNKYLRQLGLSLESGTTLHCQLFHENQNYYYILHENEYYRIRKELVVLTKK